MIMLVQNVLVLSTVVANDTLLISVYAFENGHGCSLWTLLLHAFHVTTQFSYHEVLNYVWPRV